MPTTLPLAPLARLIKKFSNLRVSDDARTAMAEVLEDFASKISRKAAELAVHAKRKTIRAEDIRLAAKEQ